MSKLGNETIPFAEWWAGSKVHRFFSRVQEAAIQLARLAGIAVDLVNARGTSSGAVASRGSGTVRSYTYVDDLLDGM